MIYLSSEGHEHRQYNGEQQCIVIWLKIGVSMVQDFNLPSPIAMRGLGSYIAVVLRPPNSAQCGYVPHDSTPSWPSSWCSAAFHPVSSLRSRHHQMPWSYAHGFHRSHSSFHGCCPCCLISPRRSMPWLASLTPLASSWHFLISSMIVCVHLGEPSVSVRLSWR